MAKAGSRSPGVTSSSKSRIWLSLGISDTAKIGMQIAFLVDLAKSPLEITQGRILKKHHGKSAHQTIVQFKPHLARLPSIGDLVELIRKNVSESRKAQMFFDVHAP